MSFLLNNGIPSPSNGSTKGIPGVLLTWNDSNNAAYAVYIDATPNEQHSANADITQHKVETGPDITDHIRPLPRRVSIQGVITNTPLKQLPTLQATSLPGIGPQNNESIQLAEVSNNTTGAITPLSVNVFVLSGYTSDDAVARDISAYVQINDARFNGYIVSVYTSLNYYPQMGIESFVPQRSARTGNALDFTMELKEIITATSQIVTAPAPKIQITHRGNKSVTPATGAQAAANATTLDKILYDGK